MMVRVMAIIFQQKRESRIVSLGLPTFLRKNKIALSTILVLALACQINDSVDDSILSEELDNMTDKEYNAANSSLSINEKVVLDQNFHPKITSSQLQSRLFLANSNSTVQIHFTVSNIPSYANIAVGLSQRPPGSGLANPGRFPTFFWSKAVEQDVPYQVELIVRDVNECMRLGGESEVCWLSEGTHQYRTDSRYDTLFPFEVRVGRNIAPAEHGDIATLWQKFKNLFR